MIKKIFECRVDLIFRSKKSKIKISTFIAVLHFSQYMIVNNEAPEGSHG
jgi:hypothetical protein